MKIQIKLFEKLPEDSKAIREEVFVLEQGFEEEFDSVDNRAVHFLAYSDTGIPIGTCRVFKANSEKIYYLGRLAVVKKFRNYGIGRELLNAAESYLRTKGAEYIYLHSQQRAMSFYQKCGYCEFGEIELEENCPHIWMKKSLN